MVRLQYDTIVVGGGTAGVSAAIASAKRGLKTLLVEKYGFTGGMATAARVNPFAGNCYTNPFTNQAGNIQEGIFLEVLNRLKATNGTKRCTFHQNTPAFYDCFEEEKLKTIYDEMLIESGCHLLFHAVLLASKVSSNHIEYIEVITKEGVIRLYARTFIDSTGDADLAYHSNVSYEVGRKEDGLCQPCTLMFRMNGIQKEKLLSDGLYNARKYVTEFYEADRQKGNLDYPYKPWVQFYDYPRENALHFNMTRVLNRSVLNADEFTRAELEGRYQTKVFTDWIISAVPEFQNAYLETSGVQIGVRESRRIKGLYQMTATDILQGARFEDGITRSGYFIDIHNPAGGTDQHMKTGDELKVDKKFIPNQYYEIPFRSLQQNQIDNLLVACRAISTTFEAHAATRVMGTMHGVGEAAGIASSISMKKNINVSSVDGKDVRQEISFMNKDLTF